METLPPARLLASRRQISAACLSSARLLRPSAQFPGFRNTEVCKGLFVDNSQGQGKYQSGGLLSLRATARPLDNSHESFSEAVPAAVSSTSADILGWVDAFHRFTRPHTIIGTAVGIISISLLAVQSLQDFTARFASGLVQALIPALFMNVYIVGLNQIFDIDIDKVNKPYLPLASGEFSLNTGIAIVTTFAILSLGIGVYIGSRPLLWALLVSFVLGTAYSIELPLLRWKRSAFAAATCILAVRAIVVQLAFYMHMQSFVFGRAVVLSKPLLFATGFMCFFSVVIALFKDIPDLEGDRFFGIQSYTVRLGQKKVFWLCIQLLLAAYGVATVVGASSGFIWARITMVLGHAILAVLLWYNASLIDLKRKAAITGFYMFVWKLFYAEYLLIPFMR
ncbi:hypothetical protein L7F22_001367 [Adiantum nelumboides]|nr:hypothetical protein [Adiantum nelumboides]